MAQQSTPSLADITASAQSLFTELTAQGVNASDHKTIVSTAERLLDLLNQLQPHINKAESAFGGQHDAISQINTLRNKLTKIIAAYSS